MMIVCAINLEHIERSQKQRPLDFSPNPVYASINLSLNKNDGGALEYLRQQKQKENVCLNCDRRLV